jgi:HD-like signal output (HDOD) protein/CheY-like chemotaxis protein
MKRILFVDDEPNVLAALRALLRPQRSQWDTVFVESGEQALVELDRASFDVIVSDMRMPGMDGATLLQHVLTRHPAVVRIVLSGYSEMESALRSVPVAHQFLAKPCDAGVLQDVIERACTLQALIDSAAVHEIVGRLQTLPATPRVYFELTRVLANDDAGVPEVVRVVEQDPTLVAKVLQLANSAFLGLGRRVSTIAEATAYLGTRMIKDLTLMAHVFDSGESAPGRAMRDAVQQHSLLVGSTARRLASNDRAVAEGAFVAGILHDIGKLVMTADRSAEYEELCGRAAAEQRPLFELERDEYGATHAELGGYLLGLWGLPYPAIETAASHHAPDRVDRRPGLDVFGAVYIANVLTHEQEAGTGMAVAFEPLDPVFIAKLGVEDRLAEWREFAAEEYATASRSGDFRKAA